MWGGVLLPGVWWCVACVGVGLPASEFKGCGAGHVHLKMKPDGWMRLMIENGLI